ncbi:MAG: hypothetical protein B6D58_00130 [candidate division Zixibacteria bacterium 4484_95]|nr:MAG: hypothetical protein B6D58_00130 [candidate division Zixibacteria bacterium 4484_95]
MALLFIIIGTGILSGLLFPWLFPITTNKRLIFGGIILLYGAVRMITLFRKRRKDIRGDYQ